MREKNPSMNKTVIRVEQQPSKCRKKWLSDSSYKFWRSISPPAPCGQESFFFSFQNDSKVEQSKKLAINNPIIRFWDFFAIYISMCSLLHCNDKK